MEITKHPIEEKYNLLGCWSPFTQQSVLSHRPVKKSWLGISLKHSRFVNSPIHWQLVSMRRDNEGLTNLSNGLVTGSRTTQTFPHCLCLSRRDPSWLLTLKFQYQTLNDSPSINLSLKRRRSRIGGNFCQGLPSYPSATDFKITVGLSSKKIGWNTCLSLWIILDTEPWIVITILKRANCWVLKYVGDEWPAIMDIVFCCPCYGSKPTSSVHHEVLHVF